MPTLRSVCSPTLCRSFSCSSRDRGRVGGESWEGKGSSETERWDPRCDKGNYDTGCSLPSPPRLSPPPHRGSQSSSIGVGLPPWCRLGLESQRGEGVTQAEAERSWPPGLLLTCEEKVTAEMESGPREGSRPGSGPRLASPSLPGPVPRTDTPRKFMLSAKVDSVPSAEDCPSWVTATAVRQACCLQGSQSTASSRPSVGAGAAPWPAAGCASCTEAYD